MRTVLFVLAVALVIGAIGYAIWQLFRKPPDDDLPAPPPPEYGG
jgi:hypothetical protein